MYLSNLKFGVSLAVLLTLSLGGCAPQASAPADADMDFETLLDKHWDWQVSQSPVFATSLGIRDYDDKLSDPSLEAYSAQIEISQSFLDDFKAIDTRSLSADNQLNHELITLQLETDIEAAQYGGKYMIMTNRGGPHLTLTGMATRLPFLTDADFESYISRLGVMPDYMTKATKRLQAGLDAGWSQPCAPMRGFERSIQTHIVSDVNDSVFMGPFKKKPKNMNEARFDAFKARASQRIEGELIPAFKKFERFYLENYAPACREDVGTSSMPGGADYYAHRVKLFTTTNRTPDEVHNIGLSEVARIRAEMDAVQKEAGFDGTFKEFQNYLRTNPAWIQPP